MATVLLNIYESCDEEDKGYFRTSREGWLGKKLEDVPPTGERLTDTVKAFESLLGEIGGCIDAGGAGATFLGGDVPVHSDFEVAGALIALVKTSSEDSPLRKAMSSTGGGRWKKYLDSFSKWTARSI
jgi:hypothetical protein